MRTMGDENFTQNPFYIALTKEYKDLYSKACDRKCIICVPRLSSLPLHKKTNALLTKKSELGLHILMPSPLQVHVDGLHDCVQKGYSVVINPKAGTIAGYSGFARNFSAKILSEERCYDENGRSFTLLLIDRPLGGDMDTFDRSVPTMEYNVITLSAASCEEFLRSSLPPHEAERIIGNYKKSIEQYYCTYLMLEGYVDDLANKLRLLVNKTLDSEILRVSSNINRKDAAAALEVYGHNILFHKIFDFLRDKVYMEADGLLKKNLSTVKKPTSVDGLDVTNAKFQNAEEFLGKMPSQTSPLQQLVFFGRALQGLREDVMLFHREQLRMGKTKVKSVALTADDILNLILYVMASKKCGCLRTVLAYITKFCFTIPEASLQYALTTFEAAVKFLEEDKSDNKEPVNRFRNSSSKSSTEDWDIPDKMSLITLRDDYPKNGTATAVNGNSFEKVPSVGNGIAKSVMQTKKPSPLDIFRSGVAYGKQE
ncbi:uncharacterized protein LOC129602740 [Paramacrobiotus metropolitanus]|uniref:uncharacterized protein LOC129602740 n=1 Tax=Paramacrobiotus metropolitanus TaxID=2943436 RepID=UPI0024457F1D|nr:uncharacterized protein LOC129602740 [Paramacrobiotus metropolitanus]